MATGTDTTVCGKTQLPEDRNKLEKAQALAKEYIELLKKWIPRRKRTIRELERIASDLDDIGTGANIGKVGGAATAVAGGIASVVGLFVTGGLAAPLVVGGLISSVAGTVTNVASDVVGDYMSSGKAKDAQTELDEEKKLVKEIEEKKEELDQLVDAISVDTGLDADDVLNTLLITAIPGYDGTRANMFTALDFERLMKDSTLAGMVLGGTMLKSVVVGSAGSIGAGMGKTFANLSVKGVSRIAGSVLKGAAAGAMLVWDAYLLVRTVSDINDGSGTKAASALRDVARELQNQIEEVEQLLGNIRKKADTFGQTVREKFRELLIGVSEQGYATDSDKDEMVRWIQFHACEEWKDCFRNNENIDIDSFVRNETYPLSRIAHKLMNAILDHAQKENDDDLKSNDEMEHSKCHEKGQNTETCNENDTKREVHCERKAEYDAKKETSYEQESSGMEPEVEYDKKEKQNDKEDEENDDKHKEDDYNYGVHNDKNVTNGQIKADLNQENIDGMFVANDQDKEDKNHEAHDHMNETEDKDKESDITYGNGAEKVLADGKDNENNTNQRNDHKQNVTDRQDKETNQTQENDDKLKVTDEKHKEYNTDLGKDVGIIVAEAKCSENVRNQGNDDDINVSGGTFYEDDTNEDPDGAMSLTERQDKETNLTHENDCEINVTNEIDNETYTNQTNDDATIIVVDGKCSKTVKNRENDDERYLKDSQENDTDIIQGTYNEDNDTNQANNAEMNMAVSANKDNTTNQEIKANNVTEIHDDENLTEGNDGEMIVTNGTAKEPDINQDNDDEKNVTNSECKENSTNQENKDENNLTERRDNSTDLMQVNDDEITDGKHRENDKHHEHEDAKKLTDELGRENVTYHGNGDEMSTTGGKDNDTGSNQGNDDENNVADKQDNDTDLTDRNNDETSMLIGEYEENDTHQGNGYDKNLTETQDKETCKYNSNGRENKEKDNNMDKKYDEANFKDNENTSTNDETCENGDSNDNANVVKFYISEEKIDDKGEKDENNDVDDNGKQMKKDEIETEENQIDKLDCGHGENNGAMDVDDEEDEEADDDDEIFPFSRYAYSFMSAIRNHIEKDNANEPQDKTKKDNAGKIKNSDKNVSAGKMKENDSNLEVTYERKVKTRKEEDNYYEDGCEMEVKDHVKDGGENDVCGNELKSLEEELVITVIARGDIGASTERNLPCFFYYMVPTLSTITLYAPWGCAIDASVVHGIVTNTIDIEDVCYTGEVRPNSPADWNHLPRNSDLIPMVKLSPITGGEFGKFLQLDKHLHPDILIIPYITEVDKNMLPFPEVPLHVLSAAVALCGIVLGRKFSLRVAACLNVADPDLETGYVQCSQYCVVKGIQKPPVTMINNAQIPDDVLPYINMMNDALNAVETTNKNTDTNNVY